MKLKVLACFLFFAIPFLAIKAIASDTRDYLLTELPNQKDKPTIFVDSFDKKSADLNEILKSENKLCFKDAGLKVSIKPVSQSKTYSFKSSKKGCILVKELVANASVNEESKNWTVAKLWDVYFMEKRKATENNVAGALGGTRGAPDDCSFCLVMEHTDWLLFDNLKQAVVPVGENVFGSIVALDNKNMPVGAEVKIEAINGLLTLPDISSPSNRYALMIKKVTKSGDAKVSISDVCTLHLRVVNNGDFSELKFANAPIEKSNATNSDQLLTHALWLVAEKGRAWSFESLRQLSKAQNAQQEQLNQVNYIVKTPNRNCKNIETDKPTPFDVPVLHGDKFYLTEGKRNLYLSWVGGVAPYKLVISKKGDSEPVASIVIKQFCEAFVENLNLSEGQYSLSLSDGSGNSAFVENNLLVVKPKVKPIRNPSNSIQKDAEKIDNARWLAEQNNGHWRLEAMQDIVKMLSSTPEAQVWLEAK